MQSEAGCGEENLRKEEGQVRKAERETHRWLGMVIRERLGSTDVLTDCAL